MIVTAVLSLIFALLLVFDNTKASDINGLLIFLILAGEASIPLFILSVVLYIDSSVYLKRLEKNHFEIPEKKKDYGNDLSKVERSEVVENRYAKDSKIASCVALLMYVIFVILDILYFVKWSKLGEGDSAVALLIPLLVFHLIFLVLALIFRKQQDPKLYVDDVDIKDHRKVRKSITAAIGLLIFLGLIAAFSVATAHSMTDYVHKSKQVDYEG